MTRRSLFHHVVAGQFAISNVGVATPGARPYAGPPKGFRRLQGHADLRGGAPHEAERRCGARDCGAGWVGPPATRRCLCVLRQIGDQLVARRQQGSLLASSWRPRGRCPVAPARSEAEAAAYAHIVVGDVSQDVVEIPTDLTPRAQVLQPLRLITASPVIPIGFPPLVVRSVQHTVGRSASQTVITARPASAVAGNRTAE